MISISYVRSFNQLIQTNPSQVISILFHQIFPYYLLLCSHWKINILEKEIVFSEITQDIGKPPWILKELVILYELEIVIIFIHRIHWNLVLVICLSAWCITHFYNKIIKSFNKGILRMAFRARKDYSAPHKHIIRQPFQQQPKNSKFFSSASSRVQQKEHVLKYDINTLLSLFNQMEIHDTGEVSRKGIKKIFEAIGLYKHQHLLKSEYFTFDHLLSILGELEIPNEPSIYVLSFVKILANYRDNCLQNEEDGLEEAKEVQEKIKLISQNQLERQKNRIKQQHSKIYVQMQVSQQKQFQSFEEQWKTYLKEFREQTSRRLQQTKYLKKSKIIQEEVKFINKKRKKNVITSPRLIQLLQKKKRLIHEKRFDDAIAVSNQINKQKLKINEFKEQENDTVLTKKLEKLAYHTNRYLGGVQKNLQVNLNRLVHKKREGQSIMRIRMKNLREEANRKLNEHFKSQINRLRSSFYLAANP